MKTILIAAGGTGGHIVPALNIAKALSENNCKIIYIGNKNSMEEKLVTEAGFPFYAIDIQKLYRKFTFAHFKFPWKLFKSIIQSKKIIRKFKPDLFIGTGGFVSGPVGFTAALHKIPVFLQEQNSFPGLTTRLLSRYAKTIFLGYPNAAKYFSEQKCFYSGNPVKVKIKQIDKQKKIDELNLNRDKKNLLIIGGSQGSVTINNNIDALISNGSLDNFNIIWQTGKHDFEKYSKKYSATKGIYTFSFTKDIHSIYQISDFAIARAGALTLAELEIYGISSVLIPYPYAAENHQFYNAKELEEKNQATILEQKDLTPESLNSKIKTLTSADFSTKRKTECKHKTALKDITDHFLNFLKLEQ